MPDAVSELQAQLVWVKDERFKARQRASYARTYFPDDCGESRWHEGQAKAYDRVARRIGDRIIQLNAAEAEQARPIEDVLAELAAEVPDEEWAALHPDNTTQEPGHGMAVDIDHELKRALVDGNFRDGEEPGPGKGDWVGRLLGAKTGEPEEPGPGMAAIGEADGEVPE